MSAVRPAAVAELLEHLMRRTYAESFVAGLKPAQWAALRYLARANPDVRTVSAFARLHATTKSAASQTMAVLRQKGLIRMLPGKSDLRSKQLELTPKGRELLRGDPLQGLTVALGVLSQSEPAKLAAFTDILAYLVSGAFTDGRSTRLSGGP